MLFIVPTPIGNLGDITYRAVEVLSTVDLILAEDTRVTKKLLNHYNIPTPLRSYHNHNEHKIVTGVVKELMSGVRMALVSDAGTPGISDPGYLLIREALRENVAIDVLPGATAFVPALVASGIPTDKFFFEGFLPHKKGRKTRLEFLASIPSTIILYESPHRVLKCLNEISTYLGGGRQIAICRELTKMHQEVIRGTAKLLQDQLADRTFKGEIVIVVEGLTKKKNENPKSKYE